MFKLGLSMLKFYFLCFGDKKFTRYIRLFYKYLGFKALELSVKILIKPDPGIKRNRFFTMGPLYEFTRSYKFRGPFFVY